MSGWRGAVLRFFRVPPRPQPPPGGRPRIFRAAPNYLVLRMIGWGISVVALLVGALAMSGIAAAVPADADDAARISLTIVSVVLWSALLLRVALGYAVLRLDYEMRWYMVSDRAIRIREGIATVREKTIALANVQQISLRQGPLQRLLGIADVEVRTAGGGSSQSGPHGKQGREEPMHVGYFRGVSNAEEIRDVVRTGVRRQRNAGLGDPDDDAIAAPAAAASTAADALAEARKLRAFLESVVRR
jgi:uncharacterized membrane protein YdbT with pleckstrin-like domain